MLTLCLIDRLTDIEGFLDLDLSIILSSVSPHTFYNQLATMVT